MEHRESPRVVPSEGRPREARVEPATEGHRFARLVTSPAERRLVLGRLGTAVVAAVLALLLAGVVGSQVLGTWVRWLHSRPAYQTTFAAITLEPAPPPWYRGGAALFLDRVRQAARREDVPFSALDLDLDELRREFRLYCWVKGEVRVRLYWPSRIVVRLAYRTPLAWAFLPGKPTRVLLDEDGVILPIEDADEEKAGRLIRIEGLDPPFDPRAGDVWKGEDPITGLGKPDARVLAAVKLAAFLRSKLVREGKAVPPLLERMVIHPVEKDGLFLQNVEATLIFWGEPPGAETPGNLTAEEKWDMLLRWLPQRPEIPVHKPRYLSFTRRGVVIRRDGARN